MFLSKLALKPFTRPCIHSSRRFDSSSTSSKRASDSTPLPIEHKAFLLNVTVATSAIVTIYWLRKKLQTGEKWDDEPFLSHFGRNNLPRKSVG